MNTKREWSGLILESTRAVGYAARKNRAKYAGVMIHALDVETVVGIVPGSEHRPGTYGASFIATGKPVRFSVMPMCGVTMGQTAGAVREGYTEENITCARCKARLGLA